MPQFQTTLAGEVSIEGIGVHSGKPGRIQLAPGAAGSGIVFRDEGGLQEVPATHAHVASTDLSTVLGDPGGFHVATVEHLMSALAGCGVDNAQITVAGPEIPILDGSAAGFVAAINSAGVVPQDAPRRMLHIRRTVRVEEGQGWAEFVPHPGTRYDVAIDFPSAAIGRQRIVFDLEPDAYRCEICRARTFGFMRDVEKLWGAGLALGASLKNSVVIDDEDRIVNPEGLREADEFVRHKTLDAIGDLALAGHGFVGRFASSRGGHRLNAAALAALLADRDAWELV